MSGFVRIARVIFAVLIAGSVLNACAGSQGTQSSVPGAPLSSQSKIRGGRAPAAATDVVAINAGGGAAGSFAADTDFGGGTRTSTTTAAIDTSAVTNPAPQAVYQTMRLGSTVAYTIPGLTAGAAYTVRLSFAEIYWKSAGKRVFNINVNGTQVAANFDIVATAGGADKAVIESYAATANSAGTVVITLNAVKDNAAVSAIEILSGGGGGGGPSAGVSIDAGGAAAGNFAADEDFNAGTFTYSTGNAIDASAVSDPAPQAVYQTQRTGTVVTYTVPGLTPGTSYAVRLDFAELYFAAAGQRVFNIAINGTTVATNFDIFAAAGAQYKAVAESYNAVASSSGTIVVTLTAVTNNATINGLEIATSSGATPTPTSTPTAGPTTGPTTFNDWPSYGYDIGRTGFNPNTAGITAASIAHLHVAWQTSTSSAQTQPIVATNVGGHTALLIVGSYFNVQAYDALTGKRVWQTALPKQSVQECGNSGVSGTAVYVAALGAVFIGAGDGNGSPNHVVLYRLDAATGAITGQVSVTPTLLAGEANLSHSGVAYANGRIYLGTGSDCEGTTGGYPSWRGRIVAVDPRSMTLLNTFYSTWGQGGDYGGGGAWEWGGVSADASGNVYSAFGNAETNLATSPQKAAPPFVQTTNEKVGYAEHLVKLSADLSTVEASDAPSFNFKIGYDDLDYSGTPVVVNPAVSSGCGELTATQGKGGLLVVNNASSLNEVNTFALSVPSGAAYYVGNPGYSPNTGYIYAAISSSGAGSSMLPPGLAAIGSCGSSIAWHAQFGSDSTLFSGDNMRSAPTVTAGGVVFMGTPCTSNGNGGCGTPGTVNGALWAVDAGTGTVLNGGKPVLITGGNIRMAPSADGLWLWVYDGGGNFYGLTVDPSVAGIKVTPGKLAAPTFQVRHT